MAARAKVQKNQQAAAFPVSACNSSPGPVRVFIFKTKQIC